jgi:hypothetical protein
MFLLIWLVLCLAAASLLLLPFALRRSEILRRYSGSRLVACPKDQHTAAVNIDTRRAAETAIDGSPELRLSGCTLWPDRSQCAQECLSQAARPAEDADGEAKPRTKPIYHLPVLLAAFAAWCLGALWHSQFLFRGQWMDATGLTQAQVKQMVWWLSPHLLTAGICLLFAYGVALLLAVCHRKGVLQGVLMAALFGAAMAAASWYSLAKMPHELLAIELGYAVLVMVTVGAIVGGLYGRIATAGHFPPQRHPFS